jgi:hypothetical protein
MEIIMNRKDEPQNIIKGLCERFDDFDEWEPMCSEARERFRNEIAPRTKQLVHSLVVKGDLDAARALVELFEHFQYFVQVNGPAWVREDPNDGLLQRADLDEDEQRWHP